MAAVPEAASILYNGGFPRVSGAAFMKHTQRAIYYVVRELEDLAVGMEPERTALCDRGTLDGMAYWPKSPEGFLESVGTTLENELKRYDAVIHLKPPLKEDVYKMSTTRIESHARALELDEKTQKAWEKHPKRFIVSDEPDFLVKVDKVIKILNKETA